MPRIRSVSCGNLSAILIALCAGLAAAQVTAIEALGEDGRIVTLDQRHAADLRRGIAAAYKDEAYWLKRTLGKKIAGRIAIKLRLNSEGEVADLTRVASTISDTSYEKSLVYSLKEWKFEGVDFLGGGALVTCTFAFDSSKADVPPWRYRGEFVCDSVVDRTNLKAHTIWDPGEKTCLYLPVPCVPTAAYRYSTFGNSEWILYEEKIRRHLCSNSVHWQIPDSQCYVALDSLLALDTSSSPASLPDLSQELAARLSAAGFTKCVAFCRQRGEYRSGPVHSIIAGGGSYTGPNGSYGGGATMSLTIPPRNTDQSILVAVYNVKTGTCMFRGGSSQTDYSLSDAVESVVEDLFLQLRKME